MATAGASAARGAGVVADGAAGERSRCWLSGAVAAAAAAAEGVEGVEGVEGEGRGGEGGTAAPSGDPKRLAPEVRRAGGSAGDGGPASVVAGAVADAAERGPGVVAAEAAKSNPAPPVL